MPQIIPIRDLKKTGELSKMCKEATEPILITKNGYGDMFIMSIEMYEKKRICSTCMRNLTQPKSRYGKDSYLTPARV